MLILSTGGREKWKREWWGLEEVVGDRQWKEYMYFFGIKREEVLVDLVDGFYRMRGVFFKAMVDAACDDTYAEGGTRGWQ